MRIAVIGKSGQLAQSIAFVGKDYNHPIQFIGKEDLDITDTLSVESALNEFAPEVLINCSAYTAVDAAEEDKLMAEALNVKAIRVLVDVCKRHKIFLIHVSTDYVFDGKSKKPYIETDLTNPQTVYGKTKLEGENVVLNSDLPSIVIRTSWLYSPFGRNFYKTIRQKIEEQSILSVVNDQIGVPTSALDLARVLLKMAEKNAEFTIPELFHVSNSGSATWYKFAIAIRDFLQSTHSINPVGSEAFITKAKRPHYSVLSTQKLEDRYGIQMRPWEEALKEVISLS